MCRVQAMVLLVFVHILGYQCYLPTNFHHIPMVFGFLPRPAIHHPPRHVSHYPAHIAPPNPVPPPAPRVPAPAPRVPVYAPRVPAPRVPTSRIPAPVPASAPVVPIPSIPFPLPRVPFNIDPVPATPDVQFPQVRILYDNDIVHTTPPDTSATDRNNVPGESSVIESVFQTSPDFVEPRRTWVFHHSPAKIDRELEPFVAKRTYSSSMYPYSPLVSAAQTRSRVGVTSLQLSPLQALQKVAIVPSGMYRGGYVQPYGTERMPARMSLNSAALVQLPVSSPPQSSPVPVPDASPSTRPVLSEGSQTSTIETLLQLLLNNQPSSTTSVRNTIRDPARLDNSWRNLRNLAMHQAKILARSRPTFRMNPVFDPKYLMPTNRWTDVAETMLGSFPPRARLSRAYLQQRLRQASFRRRPAQLQPARISRTRKRIPRRRSPPLTRAQLEVFLKRLDIVGKVNAARDLECDTMPEVLGLEIFPYVPMKCEHDNICPSGKVCRNTNIVGFCCPIRVKDVQINKRGIVERYDVLTNLFQ